MTFPTSKIGVTLREAWKVIRLDAMREAAEQAICELQALDLDAAARRLRRPELRRSAEDEGGARGSARAALDACCDELRDGCGLPVSGPFTPPSTSHTWLRRYQSAYDVYQDAAVEVLTDSFGPLPPRRMGRPPAV